jgi:hypothetical protein
MPVGQGSGTIGPARPTRDDHGLDPVVSGRRAAVILWMVQDRA